MKNKPTKIYLQTGEVDPDTDFNDLRGVTFCSKQINKNDLVYYEPKALLVELRNFLIAFDRPMITLSAINYFLGYLKHNELETRNQKPETINPKHKTP